MKRFLPLFAFALGWLLCAGRHAQAEPTPAPNAQWKYNFSPPVGGSQVLATDHLSGVNLTDEPTKSAAGSSDVVVTNIKAFSVSPTAVGFGSGGQYSIGLFVTDSASGQTANYLFKGQFGGTLSGSNANVTNTFLGGTETVNGATVSFTGPTSPTVALGKFNYGVSLVGYVPPGPPTASNSGSMSAHITVTPGTIVPATVPEPSALLLAGFGLSIGGLVGWRKRRRSLAAGLA
jgi:hypothetical protein